MADCARCQHMDELHETVMGGSGLGACTQGDGCVLYIEAILPSTDIFSCGMCGGLIVDWSLHTASHAL